jgi:hypothetical protein
MKTAIFFFAFAIGVGILGHQDKEVAELEQHSCGWDECPAYEQYEEYTDEWCIRDLHMRNPDSTYEWCEYVFHVDINEPSAQP